MAIYPLLLFSPAGPASTTLTVSNDTQDTGYRLLESASFGDAAWEAAYSGARGALGAKVASLKPVNRTLTLPIRVTGTTMDNLAAKISALVRSVDELRRYGGKVTYRSVTASYRVHFDVMHAWHGVSDWGNRAESRFQAVVQVNAVCAPYAEGDPMDFADGFSRDTVNGGYSSDYTADAGALTNVAVAGGALYGAANLTTQNRLTHTGRGYTYGDHEATLKVTPGTTITSLAAGVVLKRVDASNCLIAYVDDNGANSRLRIDKIVAGTPTNLASSNLGARMTTGTKLWVRARIQGNAVYAAMYAADPRAATSSTSTSVVLTAAEAVVFGGDVEGRAGIVFTPQSANASVDDLEVMPFAFQSGAAGFPASRHLNGRIPGDAPARGAFVLSPYGAGTNPMHLGLAWTQRPRGYNMMQNGGGAYGISGGVPWSVAAVTGVTGAATSVAQSSGTGKYGSGTAEPYSVRVAMPATANTGASYGLYGDFWAGVAYVALCWSSSASTTNTRLRLGVNGDIASSATVALTSAWALRSVVWRPTANRAGAYFAFEITTATLTPVVDLDGCMVFESWPMDLTASIASSSATTCTVRSIPATWPQAPFLALIDEPAGVSELVNVTAISGTTLTIARGAEGSTAATHASGTYVYPLPVGRRHIEGMGALPPFGVIEAESAMFAVTNLAPTADANARSGYLMRDGSAAAGGENNTLTINVDPSLIDADDGTQTVEILTRLLSSGDNAAPTVAFTATADGSGAAPALTTPELGTGTRTLNRPSAGSNSRYRVHRIGTLTLNGAASYIRLKPTLTIPAGTNAQPWGIDYVLLQPVGSRAMSVTGRAKTDYGNGPVGVTFYRTTVNADLSIRSAYQDADEYPMPSIGGSMIEFRPGLISVTVDTNLYPVDFTDDDTSTDSANTAAVALSVTPRWAVIRDA